MRMYAYVCEVNESKSGEVEIMIETINEDIDGSRPACWVASHNYSPREYTLAQRIALAKHVAARSYYDTCSETWCYTMHGGIDEVLEAAGVL